MDSRKKNKAVILAAGLGSRLSTLEWHKSVAPIGPFSRREDTNVSFISRQIRLLRLAGVSDVAVVVGHKRDEVIKELAGLNVKIIVNDTQDISQSGSLHSFQYACLSDFHPLDRASHTLIMDADIVYEYSVLEKFIAGHGNESSLLITPNTAEDSEEVRVYGQDKPQFIGKGLKPRLIGGAPCLGEATGIVHIAPDDHQLALELTHWLLGNPTLPESSFEFKGFGPARRKTEHEELSQRLMMLEKLSAKFLDADMLFMEVDFHTEYDACRSHVYPKILDADHRKYPELF